MSTRMLFGLMDHVYSYQQDTEVVVLSEKKNGRPFCAADTGDIW